LAFSSDYGQTVEVARDSVFDLKYHPDLDVMILGDFTDRNNFVISHDGGQTVELFGHAPPFTWGLIPSPDSLIGISSTLRYSIDSLRTWQRKPHAGLEGFYNRSDRAHASGWASGDYAVQTDFFPDNDSTRFYFSEDYCDSFFVTGRFANAWSFAYLFTGYAEGEYYLVSNQTIFCSTDTGRTWNESGECPVEIGNPDFFEIEPGWSGGELFLLWNVVEHWQDTVFFSLYYSNDYAQTWELMNSMEDPYPNDVSENSYVIPSSSRIQVYPNPTNGKITILLPGYSPGTLLLFDTLGRSVKQKNVQGTNIRDSINLDNLPSGFYWLRYISRDKQVRTEKILLLK
jgi:hypothetical protein